MSLKEFLLQRSQLPEVLCDLIVQYFNKLIPVGHTRTAPIYFLRKKLNVPKDFCRAFLSPTGCPNEKKCKWDHDIKHISPLKECSYMKNSKWGKCPYGIKCRYIHLNYGNTWLGPKGQLHMIKSYYVYHSPEPIHVLDYLMHHAYTKPDRKKATPYFTRDMVTFFNVDEKGREHFGFHISYLDERGHYETLFELFSAYVCRERTSIEPVFLTTSYCGN